MKQAMWLAAILACGGAMAQADGVTGEVGGKLLGSGNGVMILSAAGEVEWQHSTGLTHDAWLLANGNVMYADGDSVTEVTREHQVVFQYQAAEQRGGGTYGCQRLANGNTMIGENSTGKVLEVDPAGKVVWRLSNPKLGSSMMAVQKLTADGLPLPGDCLR